MIEELKLLTAGVDADADLFETSESAELDDEERTDKELTDPAEAEMNDRMARATAATSDASEAAQRALLKAELALVEEMRDIAEASRYDPDARIKKIINWVDENMCPVRGRRTDEMPRWNERRVIIFTEYEDTRRYIERCLGEAIARSDQADARIATFTGVTSRQRREEIKHTFNTEPSTHPLRILIATDAAREGLNLQRHCHDLYHFDLPWNPSRLDQRNGRIDRKLQPADEVFCRYFFYHDRPEDKVLRVLVRKAEQIRHDMGSVAQVLEGRVAKEIEKEGIRRDTLDDLADTISSTKAEEHQQIATEELEDARASQNKLQREVDTLRGRLDRSRQHIGLTPEQLRQTLSMSLRLAGAPTITAIAPGEQPAVDTPQTFTFPGEDAALAQDSGWTHVLDTLRGRRQHGESLGKWRQRAPVRPVAFEDTGRLGDNAGAAPPRASRRATPPQSVHVAGADSSRSVEGMPDHHAGRHSPGHPARASGGLRRARGPLARGDRRSDRAVDRSGCARRRPEAFREERRADVSSRRSRRRSTKRDRTPSRGQCRSGCCAPRKTTSPTWSRTSRRAVERFTRPRKRSYTRALRPRARA